MPPVDRSPIRFGELLARPGVIETLRLDGSFGILAFHGGNLERTTDLIASEVATRTGASLYTVAQTPPMCHHIPSIKVNPAESTKLAAIIDHCQHVIALHGYGHWEHTTSLLCGGQNRLLRQHVAQHLREALPAYRTIDNTDEIPRRLRGLHDQNPCNLTTGGGVQLEMPPRVRGLTPLARYWPGHNHLINRFPHLEALTVGIAAAVDSWGNA